MTATSLVRPSLPRDDIRLTFPDGSVMAGPKDATLEEYVLAWQAQTEAAERTFTAVLLGDQLRSLSFVPSSDAHVTPLDLTTPYGMRVYKRSLTLTLVAAAEHLFPGTRLNVDHSVTANGFYCTVRGREPLTAAELRALEEETRRLVRADLPIVSRAVPLAEAIALFDRLGYADTAGLLRTYHAATVEVHEVDGAYGAFLGTLVPRTGYLSRFRLQKEDDGFLLLFPLMEDPERFPEDTHFPKLTAQFRVASRWLRAIGAEDAGSLNLAIERRRFRELVLVAEALHERRIATIAETISSLEDVRIVFVAGPTSSGKTTWAKRLGIQLAASGIQSFAVAMDDYFVERSATPLSEDGTFDFEAFDAVDHDLFQRDMLKLLAGERVRMPRYDFVTGIRVPGREVALPKGTVLIVEGLHGLNPGLLPQAPREALYRVYVSCLTQLNLDHHHYVPTSDARLLRRLVRDARTRGHTAESTVLRWQSVRRGERRFIFPYQEQADVFFNSALPYEIAVLKPLAEPLLLPYDHDSPAALEVRRLLDMLALFLPAEASAVPDNSLLREFIGGSIMEHVHLAGSDTLRDL
ncbi:MAG: nucleoside kinase [Anaerolineae bacterium]|nr:nucleoside kinase [Anaerolineae bacterium]